jgi:carboxylesterase type B
MAKSKRKRTPKTVLKLPDLEQSKSAVLNRLAATRHAGTFGAPCAQLPARWFPYIEGNEDCLSLNVWTTEPSLGFEGPAHPN